MPWHRNEPDPLEAMRRKLAEQERAIAEQASRLMAELHGESPDDKKPAEPPVWRLEEDGTSHRSIEPMPARKRNLARQRQRDMVLFILLFLLFVCVLIVVIWIANAHSTAPANGF